MQVVQKQLSGCSQLTAAKKKAEVFSEVEAAKYDFGVAVDRMVTSFASPAIRPAKGLPRGIDARRFRAGRIHMLYEAAMRTQGRPLCLAAAERLLKLEKDSTVLFLTGVLHPVFFPKGETDGPPGVVGLARALNLGLGLRPVILSEAATSDIMRQASASMGLSGRWDRKMGPRPRSADVMSFPVTDVATTQKEVKKLLDKLNPSAVVAIERKGRNTKGEYHSVLGTPRGAFEAKLDYVTEEANNRGILTIGIGDNGNEIGFGNIIDDVKKIQMFGELCQCPCKGGIATVVKTDLLIPASTSNWGAYGIEACVAFLLGRGSLMHDSEVEKRVLEGIANLGCGDGATIETTPTCDGTGKASLYLVDFLKSLVDQNLETKTREF
ncbi:MAG: DUF4392 domain-containing protein [Thaumarchaeota archaeon]|nr:DUF4392 domain-containing protein [Nitrososphaerota archaeon]